MQSAYYTCFLYIKYLTSRYLISDRIYNNFSNQVNRNFDKKKKGSHELLFYVFNTFLKWNELETSLYHKIDTEIHLLKKNRVKATYETTEITDKNLLDILQDANSLIGNIEEVEQEFEQREKDDDHVKMDSFRAYDITSFSWTLKSNGRRHTIYL